MPDEKSTISPELKDCVTAYKAVEDLGRKYIAQGGEPEKVFDDFKGIMQNYAKCSGSTKLGYFDGFVRPFAQQVASLLSATGGKPIPIFNEELLSEFIKPFRGYAQGFINAGAAEYAKGLHRPSEDELLIQGLAGRLAQGASLEDLLKDEKEKKRAAA